MTGAFPTELAELLGELRLPPPVYPQPLLDRLVPTGPMRWTSDPDFPSPYRIGQFLDAIDADSAALAALGHDGHGANSWALHFHLVDGPLAALVQSPFGGVYGDPDDNRLQLAIRLARLERIRAAVTGAAEAGRIGPGERLFYADLGFAASWAGWLDGVAPSAAREAEWAVDDAAGFTRLVEHLAKRVPFSSVSSR